MIVAPPPPTDLVAASPVAGDITLDFHAAHPASYTTATVDSADSGNDVEALSSDKRFACGDLVVYYTTVTVSPAATPGASELTVNTFFDSSFGRNSNVGFTNVTALIAADDSQQSSDGGETILDGDTASGPHGPDLTLSTTISDVEAGETIVIEYRATLTCSDPPGAVTGNLQSGIDNATIEPSDGPPGRINVGQQTVPLFASSISISAAPLDPAVEQPECVDGEVTEPTLELATEPSAITYSASPGGPYAPGDVVTVTATLNANFSWPPTMPAGWTITSATTATFTVTFDDAACIPVEPEDPTVDPGTVDPEGEPVTPPEVIVPETPGVDYEVDPPPPYEPGDEVTVIAELEDGFAWVDPLPSGWTEVDPDTAIFALIIPEPSVVTTTTTTPSGTLPATGSSGNGWMSLAAVAAMLAGLGLVRVSRRP